MKAFVFVMVGALIVAACGSGTPVGGACKTPTDCVSGSTCILQEGSGVCAKTCQLPSDCTATQGCALTSELGCCTGCSCKSVDVCVALSGEL